MNIRYRFENRKKGDIEVEILDIEEIEVGCVWNAEDWQILSRDLGTGLKAQGNKEVFENDKVSVFYSEMFFEGNVEGVIEYSESQACFTVEFLDKGCGIHLSALEPDNIEIIGRAGEE